MEHTEHPYTEHMRVDSPEQFIGMFGIHNFYLGYMRRGLLQVIVSAVGLALIPFLGGFSLGAPIVMGLWGLLEGYQLITGAIRVDADGNFLT